MGVSSLEEGSPLPGMSSLWGIPLCLEISLLGFWSSLPGEAHFGVAISPGESSLAPDSRLSKRCLCQPRSDADFAISGIRSFWR